MSVNERYVYLDYNATAPLLDKVKAAMSRALELYGNPSSVHRAGREARAAIEDAREAVAAAVGARPADVIWTSGGTEANALALSGLVPGAPVWTSAIEHPSVGALSDPSRTFPVTSDGYVDLTALETAVAALEPPFIVSLMLVNNETGVVQPVQDAARIVKARGGTVHCDTVQALGRLPIDMGELGVDAVSVSAHKLGGPKGVGALVLAPSVKISPLIRGGGQERGRRGGTENTIGIVGFGAAVNEIGRLIADQPRIANLRDDLERWIVANMPAAMMHGRGAARVANTACVSVAGCSSETQLIALDLAGVAVSSGSACSSGKVADSHVLKAMGIGAEHRKGALRISLGHATSERDLEKLQSAWLPVVAARAA
ncbi:MAG: cysteine desulfurase [Rhodobacteraceae bacterium]|nr:cysteine desulfurase [Paracoccaceae bacterium]